MPDHEAALRIAEELRSRRDIDAVADDLHALCRDFGLTGFCLARIAPAGTTPVADVLLRGWPAEWLERYIAEEHARRDPVIALGRSSMRGFTWTEAYRERPMPGASIVYAEAAAYGLADGYAVPVHGPGGRQGIVSFAASRLELGQRDGLILQIVALQAFAQVCDLMSQGSTEAPDRLTPREVDCLRWAADGKTSWEIAQILTISQHTADWYLTSAARKLKAASRVQAVAEAFRRGLIA